VNSKNEIELIIEGLPTLGGDTALEIFAKQLISFGKILKILDAEVTAEHTTQFHITSLSHNSPYKIGLQGMPLRGEINFAPQIIDALNESFEKIEKDCSPDFSNDDFLEKLHDFANPVGNKVHSISIVTAGKKININESTPRKIKALLSSTENCLTSWEGTLQKVDLHARKKDFYIFPTSLSGRKIKCIFPDNLKEQGLRGIEKKIRVSGLAKYRANDNVPFQIDVQEVEVYDLEKTLPSFNDIKGILPSAAGNLSSEDFIAGIRDDWK
jgi:hypothetical protein